MNQSILQALNWRYAAKQFSANKIPEAELQELFEALRLAPSSFGLQPWKFINVVNPSLRMTLRTHAYNQPQVEEASNLIVLCARTDLNETYVKKFVQSIAVERKVSVESLKGYEDMMVGFVMGQNAQQLLIWAQKQVYIALGFLLETAAIKNIDACPMEGFDSVAFDEVLELRKDNFAATVVCALGYRNSSDVTSSMAKVRFAAKEVFVTR